MLFKSLSRAKVCGCIHFLKYVCIAVYQVFIVLFTESNFGFLSSRDFWILTEILGFSLVSLRFLIFVYLFYAENQWPTNERLVLISLWLMLQNAGFSIKNTKACLVPRRINIYVSNQNTRLSATDSLWLLLI